MTAGRKPGYITHVKPRLDEVTQWRAEGLFDYHIAKKLGVSAQTFCVYKGKHPELVEALKKGNDDLVANLKNKLVERAKGMNYTEKKTYKKRDADGNEASYVEIAEKYCPPDVAALHLALKNFDRGQYGDEPWTNDPAMYNLRKDELELRKKLAEANDWQALE